MFFLEIGNTTLKIARRSSAGEFRVVRLNSAEELEDRLPQESEPVLIAPVAGERTLHILPLFADHSHVRIIERSDFADFIGDSYDTPETLGLDRILNLIALDRDGIVISCGTAITIDALADGRPRWGAIMPGFRIAAEGLAEHAPALPVVTEEDLGEMPARSTYESVANGVILGTVLAASRLAALLAEETGLSSDAPVILTGGDASLMERHIRWDRPLDVRPALMFEGMERVKG